MSTARPTEVDPPADASADDTPRNHPRRAKRVRKLFSLLSTDARAADA
jgi:hypothetical protein